MKYIVVLCLLITSFVLAQSANFSDYLGGSAEIDQNRLIVYLQNVSDCPVTEVSLRVASLSSSRMIDRADLLVNLMPGEGGLFAMTLSQDKPPSWAWTIDSLVVGGSESCLAQAINFPLVEFRFAAEGSAASQPSAELPATPSQPVQTQLAPATHTVQAGETVWRIAQSYDVAVEALLQANNKSNEVLFVGEILVIPGRSADGIILHILQAGESLDIVAAQYGSRVVLIERANCLSPGQTLNPGQELRVPPASMPSSAFNCP